LETLRQGIAGLPASPGEFEGFEVDATRRQPIEIQSRRRGDRSAFNRARVLSPYFLWRVMAEEHAVDVVRFATELFAALPGDTVLDVAGSGGH
jgi:hypothetical protein